MSIARRGSSYGVRIHDAREGVYRWVGTYRTLEDAQEAEQRARVPKERNCVECAKRFRPSDDRRVRCVTCIAKRAAGPSTDDHWLYRCFNEADELLYVGITSSGFKRFRRHGNDKAWWREVASIKLEHFDSKTEARDAEREAIRTDDPRYNRLGVKREPGPEEKDGCGCEIVPAPIGIYFIVDPECEEHRELA